MAKKQCQQCGKNFEAAGNTKYCSESCSKAARAEKRAKWIKENPEYIERKRKKNKDRRKQVSQAHAHELTFQKEQRSKEWEADMLRIRRERERETVEAAASGDLDSLMDFAEQRGDQLGYWTLFKVSRIIRDLELCGTIQPNTCKVADIDVYAPDFAERVAEIAETGEETPLMSGPHL